MIRLRKKTRQQHDQAVRQVRQEQGEVAAATQDQVQFNKERARRIRERAVRDGRD